MAIEITLQSNLTDFLHGLVWQGCLYFGKKKKSLKTQYLALYYDYNYITVRYVYIFRFGVNGLTSSLEVTFTPPAAFAASVNQCQTAPYVLFDI